MRGLMVVGTSLDAGEALVVAAVCAAARESGRQARAFMAAALGPEAEAETVLVASVTGQPWTAAHVLRTAASPAIAADHHGEAIDPAALTERAVAAGGGADLLVVSAPGGLLAPLTARYSVRDFARDLGAPVVVVARAVPGLVNGVRLTLAAARGAALPVAAVVLTRWPDPPSRVLADERRLLEQLAGVPVAVLADLARDPASLADAARAWSIAGWIEVEPESEPAAPAAASSVLEPYAGWKPRVVGDPRGTPRPQIMEALLEIVGAEGPMTATRAYALYNKASGGRKLTTVARAPLESAAHWLARENKLQLTPEGEIPWQGDDLLRLPDTPAVRVRELGPRTLEEVPLDEIAELVRRLRTAERIHGDAELKRAVLSAYGLKRLTGKAGEYLGLAIDLAG